MAAGATYPNAGVSDDSSAGGYGGPTAPLPNGNAVYKTYANKVALKPGQVLHFQKGKGYYAGPPVRGGSGGGGKTPPPPPPDPYGALSQAEIDARANTMAQSQLTPQEQAIQLEQAKADAQAKAQQDEIAAFQQGAAGILAGVAPTVGAGYNAAAGQIGELAGATGGQVAADLGQAQAQDQAFAESQGQAGGHTVNPQDVGTTMGMVNGVIPGTQVAAEGAAEQARAAEATQLPIDAGMEQIASAQAAARASDDQYAQQLLQIAQQFPGLKAQALQQLNQYELDKANYRRQLHDDNVTNAINQQDAKTRAAAEAANAKAAGLNVGYKQGELNYKWASLQLQSQKAVDAVKEAQAKGARPNAALSKVYGHVVDSNGHAIRDAQGNMILVKNATGATTPGQKAVVNRNKAVDAAATDAAKYASTVAGKPTVVSASVAQTARATGKQVGQYIAAANQKYNVPGGVFSPAYPGAPATTNNPARAQRTGGMPYAQAQQAVWNVIHGDQLMAQYRMTRAQVMALVNKALAPYFGK